MLSKKIVIALAVILFAASAFGFPDTQVVKVNKPVDEEMLWSIGFLYLANLGDAYLVQGTGRAVERLAVMGVEPTAVTTVLPDETLFLLRPPGFKDELLYSGALIDIGGGRYLAKLETDELNDLNLLQCEKTRLEPRSFPKRPVFEPPVRLLSVTPKPEIQHVVSSVSGDTLWRYISQLSGREPAVIDGAPHTLLTRYALSTDIDLAADYLWERFEGYGLSVEFQGCVRGKYDLNSGDFVDSNYGWVVGSNQRVFKTWDGGLTWVRQRTGAFSSTFWDVCFLDTLEGWVVGSDGRVYHTTDGGATWAGQNTPAGTLIYGVYFLDSLNGWIAGWNGTIARTTDGGQNWISVPSGTGEALYGFHFQSPARGWLCGDSGTILFWDGVSWTPQTSGATDYLWGVQFVDDNTGWVAGGDRTVLRTNDGGQNWFAQVVPPEASYFLIEVCFLDSTEGWVVGWSGTLLHTVDGGATWEMSPGIRLSDHMRWIGFVDSTEAWAVGPQCTILHTADGGTSWENQIQNLPSGAWKLLNNVVATKPGTTSEEQVIICGHYDSISEDPLHIAPGANDNASGTAAVLEVARVMAPYPYERTIKFICFTGEEMGPNGSAAYVDSVQKEGDVILGALNLDMIGYVDVSPEAVDLVGDPPSEWLVDLAVDCSNAYVPGLPTAKVIDETYTGSDHASFWWAGYSSMMATDDAPPSDPYYHTTGDTLGNLTQTFATDVVRAGIATVAELAIPDSAAAGIVSEAVAFAVSVHPNPFSSSTTISLTLGTRTTTAVSIFNVEGKLLKRLLAGTAGPGRYDAVWDGRDDRGSVVPPGIYFARVRTASGESSAKVILLR
jgi:photosystem II stability/assembly factor-like uncharacterized protein